MEVLLYVVGVHIATLIPPTRLKQLYITFPLFHHFLRDTIIIDHLQNHYGVGVSCSSFPELYFLWSVYHNCESLCLPTCQLLDTLLTSDAPTWAYDNLRKIRRERI